MRAPFLLVYCVFAQELWAAAHIDPEEGGGFSIYTHIYKRREAAAHTCGPTLKLSPPSLLHRDHERCMTRDYGRMTGRQTL